MNFQSFNLHQGLEKSLAEAGYKEPTLIQQEAIPQILKGLDIRGSAQTGTGKTAAFLLPALHLLSTKEEAKGKGPRLLILVPTRELGLQIAAEVEKYSKHLPHIKSVAISGGIPYHKQLPKLSKPYDVLIATPGRLIDFMKQKKITFPRLQMLVLDEADRMLDMGFLQPVEEIIKTTPEARQTLLFSATLSKEVCELSKRILKNPVDVSIENCNTKHENIEQKLHFVKSLSDKNNLLDEILSDKTLDKAIIFTSTKRHADQLVSELWDKGHNAGVLHGDIPQRKRAQTIHNLRKGGINILVATDVAARGLDIDSITHVINFDFPQNPEDYVHRIGRTGRAGAKGIAHSFVSNRDKPIVKQVEKTTKHAFEKTDLPDVADKKDKKDLKNRPRKPFFNKGKKRFFRKRSAS